MITRKDIDDLEDRVTRHFPNIDVTTVNMIRGEIAFLRGLLEPKVVETPVETVAIEEKLVVEPKPAKPVRGKTKEVVMLDEKMDISPDAN